MKYGPISWLMQKRDSRLRNVQIKRINYWSRKPNGLFSTEIESKIQDLTYLWSSSESEVHLQVSSVSISSHY